MQPIKSSLILRILFLVFVLAACSSQVLAQTAPIAARITQAIDEANLVTLRGNVHPLARPQFDQGPVADSQPMKRMLLLLQRSPEQEAALQQLLDDQQNKSSANYHAWLTPDQFGKQFGPADADIQTVTQWLTSHGFTDIKVGPGRNVIEFSGNVGQVRNAFHTEIHRYTVEGKDYSANSADPQIPSASAPVVAGVVSLHNFPKRSHLKYFGQFRKTIGKPGLEPLFTFPNPSNGTTFYGLGPGDFATIYNSNPLISTGNDGTGQTIAIVGETNINVADVQAFRQMFGLPANFTASNVIVNGPDPGITSVDEEAEADLDTQWSGAVAPGATVQLVVSASTFTSAGIDLSALYIIENNLAAVMSESYGECEAGLGTTGNAFYNTLWEQAAAQGITVILSSGDGGSAGCDDFNTQQVATRGLAVSGLASTPFNIAVGGTDFDQINQWSLYWNATNSTTGTDTIGTSAKSYIPEIPWNENCAQIGISGCGASAPGGSLNIVAGSGGPSTVYSKPKWQMGVAGMPNDGHRDQPDVSLFASPGFDGTGYIYCQSDHTLSGARTCDLNLNTILDFGIIGGTSASAPAFAGIMALLNQYESAHAGANRQGNANYVLYALANKTGASCTSSVTEAAGCIFNDVVKGNSYIATKYGTSVGTNSVPCNGGTPNCSASTAGSNGVLVTPSSSTTEAWMAAAGYDMATGLGSVNVNNLVTNWGTASTVSTSTTLTLSPATGITHGANENVNVDIVVTPKSGTATGDASLIANLSGTTEGLAQFTLGANGTISATTQSLPGGTYTVTAHYAGDGTNGPSDSNAVPVTVAPESSKTLANLATFDINGTPTNFAASNATYGAGYSIFRVDVGDAASSISSTTGIASNCSRGITNCPTGTISLASTGAPLATGSLSLNSLGYAETLPLPPGSYSVTANYPGDSSYNASAGSTSFVIAQAPTTVTAAVAGSPVQLGNFTQIDATLATTSDGIAPTGSFQFFVDGNPLGGPVPVYEANGYFPGGNPPNYAWADAITGTQFNAIGNHTLSVQYSGDANYATSTSATTTVTVTRGFPLIEGYGATPTQINLGQQTTLTAQIIGTATGVTPSGTVTFYDGATALSGTVAYTSQSGTLNANMPYTPTTLGTHLIGVGYSGDTNYLPETTPATAPLTVVGPDFSMTSTGTLTQSVNAGTTATFTNAISVTPQDGFASQINLSCTLPVAATYTTCTVSPNMLASGSGTASVSVTTTARGLLPPSLPFRRFYLLPELLPFLLLILLLSIPVLRAARTRRLRLVGALPLATLVLFILLQAIGCGGGSSTPPPPPPPTGTPAGTYTITVTGTSGNLTHTTSLTLTVN